METQLMSFHPPWSSGGVVWASEFFSGDLKTLRRALLAPDPLLRDPLAPDRLLRDPLEGFPPTTAGGEKLHQQCFSLQQYGNIQQMSAGELLVPAG